MSDNNALEGDYEVNESVEVLMNAWRTEMNAPEILPYKEELVKEMKSFIPQENYMKQNLKIEKLVAEETQKIITEIEKN